VNNAGIQRTGDFITQDPDMQLREININLGGVTTGMRLVLPEMIERDRGHIVNVASMAAKMTVPGAAVYSASKFGVASLSRAVRAEIAGADVTVTTLLPSAVETELTAGLDIRGVPKAAPDDVAREILASCRHGQAEVTLPRWLGPIGTIEQAVPEKLGEFVKRAAGAKKRISADNEKARKYRERISRS
jgi:short-subunit dehydrogenase